jgi:thioredoxin reductase (NADPH)
VSDYLITQLKATPSIGVRLRTRVAGGHGQARLVALTLEDVRTGQREQVPAAAVFVMIGAEPRTQWRRDLVKLNDRGFVLTGHDVPPGAWPLPRPPLPFKTSLLGDQDAGCPEPGNLRAANRVGQSDRLQLGAPGAQAIRVCRK